MSKVITFSRNFPSYHPKKGSPTYFVEKVLKSIDQDHQLNVWNRSDLSFINQWALTECKPKHHTIRAGNRWKVGDKFSPRVWSDKPYKSKQITIAPDIEIKQIYLFAILDKEDCKRIGESGTGIFINNKQVSADFMIDVAQNDGLELTDALAWFKYPSHFYGQIICWNENINY